MNRQNNRRQYDLEIKLLTLGDSGVGKTSLLMRYADDSFSESFITTIGIDIKFRYLEIDGKTVKVQVYDSAGQERFRSITTSFYRRANGLLLVYDVTDRASFEHIANWMHDIERNADPDISIVLVANKSDCPKNKLAVTEEEGKVLAEQFKIPFIQTSAKTNTNVSEAFDVSFYFLTFLLLFCPTVLEQFVVGHDHK